MWNQIYVGYHAGRTVKKSNEAVHDRRRAWSEHDMQSVLWHTGLSADPKIDGTSGL